MTDPISPVGGVGGASGPRRVAGRAADGEDALDSGAESAGEDRARVPMVIEPAAKPPPPRSRRAALAAFAAQLLGQGAKRGLRGGPETLDKARTAYLEAEWSGPSDRRLRSGRITRTEI